MSTGTNLQLHLKAVMQVSYGLYLHFYKLLREKLKNTIYLNIVIVFNNDSIIKSYFNLLNLLI